MLKTVEMTLRNFPTCVHILILTHWLHHLKTSLALGLHFLICKMRELKSNKLRRTGEIK